LNFFNYYYKIGDQNCKINYVPPAQSELQPAGFSEMAIPEKNWGYALYFKLVLKVHSVF